MVRGDYQVGVHFSAGGYQYEIMDSRGNEVLLKLGTGKFWWGVTPSQAHTIIYTTPEVNKPYAKIIRKINEIKSRRESLGYVY